MNINLDVSRDDMMVGVVVIIVLLVVFAVGAFVLLFVIKKRESKLPVQTAKIKVIEKPEKLENRLAYWVTVEYENGYREQKRVFPEESKIILSVGDEGIIKYQGKTIKSFSKE